MSSLEKLRRQKVFLLVAISVLSAVALLSLRGWHSDADDVALWLDKNQLGYMSDVVTQAGGTSLHDVFIMMKNVHKYRKLTRVLTKEQLNLLEQAVRKLQDELELQMWLLDHSVDSYLNILRKFGVVSLRDLLELKEADILDVLQQSGHSEADSVFLEHLSDLRHNFQQGRKVTDGKAFIEFVKNRSNSQLQMFCTGVLLAALITSLAMLLASLSAVSGLSTVSNLCYQALPSTKASIYEFLTGRYSTPHSSQVTWDWSEPQTVGKAMTFGVRFFQKNGSPYPVSDGDGILIEIVQEGVLVARTVEFSGDKPADVNLVRCSFTVHKSGEYRISIMVGGRHIKDSPFSKYFEAGRYIGESFSTYISRSLI